MCRSHPLFLINFIKFLNQCHRSMPGLPIPGTRSSDLSNAGTPARQTTMEFQTSVTRAGSNTGSSPSAANVWGSSLRHGCGSKLKSGGGSSRTTPVDHPCFRCAWQVRETALESSTPKEAEVDHVPVGPNSQTLRISLVPGPGARSSLPVLDFEISLSGLDWVSNQTRGRGWLVTLCCVLPWCREASRKPCFACVASRLCFWCVHLRLCLRARRYDAWLASFSDFTPLFFFPFVFFSFFSLLFTLTTSSNPFSCPVFCSVSSLDFWGFVGETFESRQSNYTLDDG
ncbi:hypothetical protein CCUS01_06081 [Colletotrichum cuscutae]|uniref:Uncharacterized protein n=1 Tax=Colletotrichum cuscutae TaxID=1209917 RepID=A0AAI9V815_9PEZI|nr:hypothetical protein CCUS01_06081 [Colletotrichum cuscutae]